MNSFNSSILFALIGILFGLVLHLQANTSAICGNDDIDYEPRLDFRCTQKPSVIISPDSGGVYLIAEEMPRFPGCEEMTDPSMRKNCSDKKFMEFVYGNFTYPTFLSTNCIVTRVIVSFIIEKDGTISGEQIQRGTSKALDYEALRVIGLMRSQSIHWTPGKQNGLPVRIKFTMPITLELW